MSGALAVRCTYTTYVQRNWGMRGPAFKWNVALWNPAIYLMYAIYSRGYMSAGEA
jgi:hypothetical protein